MTDQEAVNKFKHDLQTAFSTISEQIEVQIDFDRKYSSLFSKEYGDIIKITNSVKDSDTLSALMDVYLKLFFNYYSNKNNVHFYRSDQAFKELVQRCTKLTKKTVDLYSQWAELVLGASPDMLSSPIRKRFDELNETTKSEVRIFLSEQARDRKSKEAEERRAKKSILDILKDEFIKRNSPKIKFERNSQLYDFNPLDQPALKGSLLEQIAVVRNAWQTADNDYQDANIKQLENALKSFREYLITTSNSGALSLFQVIKYIQDIFSTRREPMKDKNQTQLIEGERSELIFELYAMALIQLLVLANAKLLLQRNRSGFTAEERAYFLGPIEKNKYHYFSNIAIRFSQELKDVDALYDGSRVFLNLSLLTRHQLSRTILPTMNETLDVARKWKEIMDLTDKIKKAEASGLDAQTRILLDPRNLSAIQTFAEIATSKVDLTQDGPELSKGVITVGDWPDAPSVHGKVRIVYIDPKNNNRIFIEFESLKPNLFIVDRAYLKDKLYGSRIYDIYKSTVGMLELMELYFLAIGFMPVLVEAGFGGLITEIIIYYAGSKLEAEVAEINPKLGMLVGLIFQIAAPRPKFGPKIATPSHVPTVKNFNTVRILEAAQTDERSLADILIADENAERLALDGSKGKFSRAADTVTNLKAKGSKSVANIVESLQGATERDLGTELVADGRGASYRLRTDEVSSRANGGGSRGTGRSTTRLSDVVRKQNSKTLKQLEEFSEYLTPNDAHVAEQEANSILSKVDRGTLSPADAKGKLTNLLNRAKEKTSEYVTDGSVRSTFKVRREFRIPRRKNGVPVLDKVYIIENPQTGQLEYLLVEIKGGESTRLGWVTKKEYVFRNGKLEITAYENQWVRQASPEWYYQKIIEIYEIGDKKMALQLWEAAKTGKVQSGIIKSGIARDPYPVFNTEAIVEWFKSKELPYPTPRSPRTVRGR